MLSLRAAARHNGRRRVSLLPRCSTRHLETATVTDGDIARLAARPLHPLTLADLCKHGRPPLSAQQLLNSANFTLSILPSRLAHRLQSLRSLPYIVVANPNVSKIHGNYLHSLSTLLPMAERPIETLEEEIRFTEIMADLVQTHSNTIAILAKGFLEARKYITPREITAFLDEHLRARIGTRLIAEQHLALHFSSQPYLKLEGEKEGRSGSDEAQSETTGSYIGVIDTALQPAAIIRSCENMVGEICELKYGVRPTVVIDGRPETTIAHIPMHLEYILTELLKNSFRATIEAGMEKEAIEITIAPAPAAELAPASAHYPTRPSTLSSSYSSQDDPQPTTPSQHASSSSTDHPSPDILALETRTPGVTIRIRDRGGGIAPENYAHLWEYGFTTFNEDEILEKTSSATGASSAGGLGGGGGLDVISGTSAATSSSLAGLGYGLPLGRAYAEYFGGGIAMQSLWGWGTDVYLSLRGVGRIS